MRASLFDFALQIATVPSDLRCV